MSPHNRTMSKVIRARVLTGRYKDQEVRVTNVSLDELGKKRAAVIFSDGTRANLPASELELIPEKKDPVPETPRPRISSPFLSGAASSRSLNQTKSLVRVRAEAPKIVTKETLAVCETCGEEYNLEERKGQPGKLTQCENCAVETETKAEGTMVFSHKTGATIEIKKDGELLHEAPIFDPKNKT